jgi:hypothetical protein
LPKERERVKRVYNPLFLGTLDLFGDINNYNVPAYVLTCGAVYFKEPPAMLLSPLRYAAG